MAVALRMQKRAIADAKDTVLTSRMRERAVADAKDAVLNVADAKEGRS
jgi:hypothetical protein